MSRTQALLGYTQTFEWLISACVAAFGNAFFNRQQRRNQERIKRLFA